MTEATVHARIQTFLQALDTFDDADVSLRDYHILDANASPPYAVISATAFTGGGTAVSYGEKHSFFWGVNIDLFVLPKEDNTDWAEILTVTWAVVYKLLQYFTLDSLSGIIGRTIAGDEPDYVKTIPGTKFLARTVSLSVHEKVDVAGGEYPT